MVGEGAVPELMGEHRPVTDLQTRSRLSGMMKGDLMKLRAGDWVKVRSKDEILCTLDDRGQLDGLPFMPEMLRFCGQRFRIYRRAHKTCDTVHGTGGRRMGSAVHLEGLRCNGEHHGGCEAQCLLFWKAAWLKSAPSLQGGQQAESWQAEPGEKATLGLSSEEELEETTQSRGDGDPGDPTYICQATQLPEATAPLKWWDIRQYIEDYTSGNVGLKVMVQGMLFGTYETIINAGIGLGPILRWLYDQWMALRGGVPYPRRRGRVPDGTRTPDSALGLVPGEWVRVKKYEEILNTLDRRNQNRGLYFDAEEVPYCGQMFKVLGRVNRIINEKTGKMMVFKTGSVLLEGAYCQARYSSRRLFCPRSIYPMWREAWLERAHPGETAPEDKA